MTAQQAAIILEDEIDVQVIPSKTIPQGLSACINFNPDVDFDMNVSEMNDAISMVKTGQVTYAIKDTTFVGLEIKAGDYMGIAEKEIVISTTDHKEVAQYLVDHLIDDSSEVITLIYGQDVEEEFAQELAEYIEENHDVEVEVHSGGQPVYSFIVGVE